MQIAQLLDIGVTDDLTKKEQKRVRLLNRLCFISIIFNAFMGISVMVGWGFQPTVQLHTGLIFSTLLILFLSYKKLHFAARIGLWVTTYIAIFIFSKFLEPAYHNDYYFVVLAVLPLMFFDNRWVTVTGLVMSGLGFYAVEIYDNFNSVENTNKYMNSGFVLFTVLYLIVNYFKNLNEQNENALEAEKKTVMESNTTIDRQKKALEELNNFKSHFFVNLSHELRTPLTLIKGNNEKLQSLPATQYNKDIRSIATSINDQSEKIHRIIDDVIDLSKMEFGKLQLNLRQIELRSILKQVYHAFHSNFQHKKIHFELSIPEQSVMVNIDLVYFERALGNILNNALKYTKRDGIVKLQAKVAGSWIEISVSDTGIGIAEQDLNNVFKRFYQSKQNENATGGSGIGLSFSKEVIELLKGEITVESRLDYGSTFVIRIPTIAISDHKEIAVYHEPEHIESPLDFKQQITDQLILIVDDHEEMRAYVKDVLRMYRCIEAKDGVEALRLLKDYKIAFVITDYMMPNMDGYNLIIEIKKQGYNCPILMLSARADIEDKLSVLRLGIDDYLAKPFNQNELRIRINNALSNQRSLLQNQDHIEDERQYMSGEDSKWLADLQQMTIDNCSRHDFGLEEIMSAFAISQSTLYRKLKTLTGLSPLEFIREIKLQEARRMLEERGDLSVKQLAHAVGFKKTSHFSTLYLKRFGRKPIAEG